MFFRNFHVVTMVGRMHICTYANMNHSREKTVYNFTVTAYEILIVKMYWLIRNLCVHAQSCPTLCNPMDYSLPGSSVHQIFEAMILEWVGISFSRGFSQPRDWTLISCVFCIGRQILCHWATGEVLEIYIDILILIYLMHTDRELPIAKYFCTLF